jgi:Fic family protein
MMGTRGDDKSPGDLRHIQVFIGERSASIDDARFIPPPPEYVRDLLADWELFVNSDLEMPPLIQCALMHYQFEAIHPFEDGNGRIGRLLIIIMLHAKNVLTTPLLYLSGYFEKYRDDYMNHLLQVSISRNWTGWLDFFLRGFTIKRLMP